MGLARFAAVGGVVFLLAGCADVGLGLPPKPPPAPFVPSPTYSVFFESFSTDLTPDARKVLADVAGRVREANPSTVLIEGYAGKPGTQEQNQQLSRDRMEIVAKALVAQGVPAGKLLKIAKGESAAGFSVVGDRRVDITLANGKP